MRHVLVTLLLALVSISAFSQRGKIIRPASTAIMDPNNDGFVSVSTTGFSNDGFYADEFELAMFALPKLGGDVAGDNVGQDCGITDLIPDMNGSSVYALRDAANNLIFRFRVGDDNPSVEAWTILLDTDGKIGSGDPNATAGNPGFEVDITLIKRNNQGILVYNIDGDDNCPASLLFYDIDSHFQISIADEVSCGDPDYFYDFYVPFAEIASAMGLSLNTGIRFAAVTNVSATCALGGTLSDISGVDNNDPAYSGCENCAFEDIINNQCPTAVADLCETCGGFEKDKVSPPVIHTPIRAGQLVLTGNTIESDIFLRVQIFSNIAAEGNPPQWGTTPRVESAVYAIGNDWTVVLNDPLLDFDKIVAIAQKDEFSVPCGASGNNSSSTSVTVVAPNSEPLAHDQSLDVIEDTPKAIALAATDAENDLLTYSIVTPPSHGTLTGTLPNLTYTPNPDYFGADSFSFQVSDGIFNSLLPGTISITVTPVNDAPVANNLNASTPEETPVAINLIASDVEGDALTFSIVTPPAHGVLSGAIPNLTYTPNNNYFGGDSFTFSVSDGELNSNIATASINVTPVNDTPLANSLTASTPEDVAVGITLSGSDADGDALTFTVVSIPANGVLSGSGANLTYTPKANFFGNDVFTFRVNDGQMNSPDATVSITVTPVDDNQVAINQSVTTAEDTPVGVTLSATNIDNDPLTYSIVAAPANGSLSGAAPNVTYTPASNYSGADSFTFRVNNGTTDSNVATASITVTPAGDAPVAIPQSVVTAEDTPLNIILTGSDPDMDALTFSIVTTTLNGTLSGTASNITYTPNPNFSGDDSFTFLVNDGTVDSPAETVLITVTPADDNPVANNQSITTQEDTPVGFVLSVTNLDADPLSYVIVTPPAHGELSGAAPNLTYTPDADYSGQDVFTYKVNNGSIDSNTGTVSITITPVLADPPVADDQTIVTLEDVAVDIVLSGSDPDLDPITYTLLANPANGVLTGTPPDLNYRPNLNFNGSDSFTFKVNDGTADSPPATISITVTPSNDPPVAFNMNVTFDQDTPVPLTLAGADPDGDALTFTVTVQPAHGVLSGAAPNVTYTPDAGFAGNDSFKFVVNDGTVNSNEGVVSLLLTPLSNIAPVAVDGAATTSEDVPVAVVIFASDDNGDALTYSITQAPSNGALNISGTSVTYTPGTNFNGADVFRFEATDGLLTSNEGTVDITITPVNDVPSAASQSISTPEDTPKLITLTGTDIEGATLTFEVLTLPAHGAVTLSGGNATYTPAMNYIGVDFFAFRVNDGTLNSATATISVTITPVNDAPVADDQDLATDEDTPLGIVLSASDVDNDVTYSITQLPGHGSLIVAGANITYTPVSDYSGADSFSFIANDGSVDSNVATVSINVLPVNDAPIASGQSKTTNEDTPVAITLAGVDPEGSTLSYEIVSSESGGTIEVSGATVMYTPAENFSGGDSFTFRVNDGLLNSSIATVFISVVAINDVPLATGQDLATPEDMPLAVLLQASDPDNSITYSIAQQPLNGTLSGSGDEWLYTPNENYNGPDSFTFTAGDGIAMSDAKLISITVTPVNDLPIADPQNATTNENQPKDITLTGSDIESSPLAFAIAAQPANGNVVLTGATATYTPSSGFSGTDSFTFTVNDGEGNSAPAAVSIQVISLGSAPVATDHSITTNEDTPVDVDMQGLTTDHDGDALTHSVTAQPSHGNFVLNAAVLTYSPESDYTGNDTIRFVASDDIYNSNAATIVITVLPVNDPPVADDLSVGTDEDVPVAFTLSGFDQDENSLTYRLTKLPVHGTLTGAGPMLTYEPEPDFHGADSFEFRVNDGFATSNIATVSITVSPLNDAPVISPLTYLTNTKEDSVLRVCLNVVDVDQDEVIFGDPVSIKNGGQMTREAAPFDFCYIFRPAQNFNGESVWQMLADDSHGASGATPARILVYPVNDPVVALNDYASVKANESLQVNVIANDLPIASPYQEFYDIYEADSSDLVMISEIIRGPVSGTASIDADGISLIYQPASFTSIGQDSIVYLACDSGSPPLCAQATLFIDVADNDFPFKVYEGISPNNDGVNDYLQIDGIHRYTENLVRIFDRFNNLVWEMENYNNEDRRWEGQSNHGLGGARLPAGTYYYTIHLNETNMLYNGYLILKDR